MKDLKDLSVGELPRQNTGSSSSGAYLLSKYYSLGCIACIIVCGLLAMSTRVSAAVVHSYISHLTEVPTGCGPIAGPFGDPWALAVVAGKLYVVDPESHVVDKFTALDKCESQIGESSIFGEEQVLDGVAINRSSNEVYVTSRRPTLVNVFGSSNQLLGRWTGEDSPSGSFVGYIYIAIDNSTNPLDPAAGYAYVTETNNSVVDIFKPEVGGGEKFVARLPAPPDGAFARPFGVAVDESNGDVYVADEGPHVVDIFRPKSLAPSEYEFVRQLSGVHGVPFSSIGGIAVDPKDGDVYVADTEAKVVDEFTSSGAYLSQISRTPSGTLAEPRGIAVGASGEVYVADSGEKVVDKFGPNALVPTNVTEEAVSTGLEGSQRLTGTVDPEGQPVTSCQFEYGPEIPYAQVVPCEQTPAEIGEGTSSVVVSVTISGLTPLATYHFRLVADNSHGSEPGADETFVEPVAPTLTGESIFNVTSTSATVSASISPGGADTRYRAEYVEAAKYIPSAPNPYENGSTEPASGVDAGSGVHEVPANVLLQGLKPHTEYDVRMVADNPLETVAGTNESFTTQAAGEELVLPDNRAWELVSPPDKYGGALQGLNEGWVVQAAEDGGAIAYGSLGAMVADPLGQTDEAQALSERSATGWNTQDIETPNESRVNPIAGAGAEYRFFSPDLSLAVVEPHSETPLSPAETNERTFYLRNNLNSSFEAIVNDYNILAGTKFGSSLGSGGVHFEDATPDLKHVVLKSEVELQKGAGKGGFYEWTSGSLQLVSVMPKGDAATGAGLGVGQNLRHVISTDGSRVFFTTGSTENEMHLFMRDVAMGKTIQIDKAQGIVEPEGGKALFQTASSDGSMVFFTDDRKLTSDSTATSKEPDLYVCAIVEKAGSLNCKMSDLTVDNNANESANVQGELSGENQGVVLGASEDGTYVYFVAKGVLATRAISGAFNLYMAHDEGSKWDIRSIATLSKEDYPDWGRKSPGELGEMTSRVSPNGHFLAFMSEERLTAYNNRDAVSGQPDEEVFMYDSEANRTVCASCNPTGARPVGMLDVNNPHFDKSDVWNEHWLAGDIPAWTEVDISRALIQSRFLSNSGRLFFNGMDALAPQDVNGTVDVYEYEPIGLGSCKSGATTFVEKANGCLNLISSGTSGGESTFMEASETGGDVFFLTQSKLVPQDTDTAFDVYDAHECSEQAPCVSLPLTPPPCTTGEACKAAPSSQPEIFGAPSSETFTGGGNPVTVVPAQTKPKPKGLTRSQRLLRAMKACRKRAKRAQAGCEAKARRLYGNTSKAGKISGRGK